MELLRSAVKGSYLTDCEVKEHVPYWEAEPLPKGGVYQATSQLSDKIQELEKDSTMDISSLANAVSALKEARITESEKRNVHVLKDHGYLFRSTHIDNVAKYILGSIGFSIFCISVSLLPTYLSVVSFHWAISSMHHHFHFSMLLSFATGTFWASVSVMFLGNAIYRLTEPVILATDVALRKLGILSSENTRIEKKLEANKKQLLDKADKLIEEKKSSLTKDARGLWGTELHPV